MGIKITQLISEIQAQVNKAFQEDEKLYDKVDLQEFEIELNLDAELDGGDDENNTKEKRKFFITDKNLKERGIAFRRISSLHGTEKEKTNLMIRLIFSPKD